MKYLLDTDVCIYFINKRAQLEKAGDPIGPPCRRKSTSGIGLPANVFSNPGFRLSPE